MRPAAAVAAIALAAVAAIALAAAASAETRPATRPATRPEVAAVRSYGALHRMMHGGETGVVRLADTVPGPHTYAVGALAGLAGEVTIVDDVVWLSWPGDEAPRTRRGQPGGEQAALLVTATVERWQSARLDGDVTLAELDAALAALAAAHGLDPPFPFLISGEVHKLDWHVIDGSRLEPGADHAAHREASQRGHEERADAVLVGFYSTGHHGVFTHHDSDVHVHAVLAGRDLTGHVDAVVIPAGTTVELPADGR